MVRYCYYPPFIVKLSYLRSLDLPRITAGKWQSVNDLLRITQLRLVYLANKPKGSGSSAYFLTTMLWWVNQTVKGLVKELEFYYVGQSLLFFFFFNSTHSRNTFYIMTQNVHVCVKVEVSRNGIFTMYEAHIVSVLFSWRNTGGDPFKLIPQFKPRFGKILLVNRWVSEEFQWGESHDQFVLFVRLQ